MVEQKFLLYWTERVPCVVQPFLEKLSPDELFEVDQSTREDFFVCLEARRVLDGLVDMSRFDSLLFV